VKAAVRHVGIVVADLEKSLRFYRDLLGLSVIRTMEEAGPTIDALLGLTDVHVTTVKLAPSAGEVQVELLRFASSPGTQRGTIRPDTPGPTHVAFTVQDLSGLYHRMRQAGVGFLSPPLPSPDGRALVVFCRDPDGTLVELVEMVERT